MLDRWAPSPGVTDPNVLQLPGTLTGSGTPLPGSVISNGPATTAIGGASALGSGMQFAGSLYGIGRSIHTLANNPSSRDARAAGVDLGEGVVNTVGSGSSAASSGIGLAGSSASHAATFAGGILGGVSGFAGTGIGTWWLAKHGRRAVSSARRYRALGQVQGAAIPAPPGAPGGALLAHAPLSANAAAFRDYAQRKNRNQTIRAGLGALSGGLGAAAGAAGIAALFGATAATPVGWGLAAAAAGIGLGLGAWKFGQWARRKYQTARHANLGKWDSFKAIFTRGKTSLQNQALAAGMTAAQNPFGQAEHHANWLLGSVGRGEQEGQDLLNALKLNHAGFHGATPADKLKLIKHRLRSSG
jgi:hypothetical protein